MDHLIWRIPPAWYQIRLSSRKVQEDEDETQLVRRISIGNPADLPCTPVGIYPPLGIIECTKRGFALQADDSTKCVCGLNDGDDGDFLIACDNCQRWVHAECFGIDPDQIPENFLCWICEPRHIDIKRAVELQKARRFKQTNVNVPPAIPTLHETQILRDVNPTTASVLQGSSRDQLLAQSATQLAWQSLLRRSAEGWSDMPVRSDSWATWRPDPRYIPSPPSSDQEMSPQSSPGLFGPRSPYMSGQFFATYVCSTVYCTY